MKFLVLALLCAIFVWESVSVDPDNYTVDCSDPARACFVPNGLNIKICFPPPSRVSEHARERMGYTAERVTSVIQSAIDMLPGSKSTITEAVVRVNRMPKDNLKSRLQLLNSAYSASVIYQYFTEKKEKPDRMFHLFFPHNKAIVAFTISKVDYKVSPGILITDKQQETLYNKALETARAELKESGKTEEQDLQDQLKEYSVTEIYSNKIIYHGTIAAEQTPALTLQNARIGQIRRFLEQETCNKKICMEELKRIAGITSTPIILIENLPTFIRPIKQVGIGSQVCEYNDHTLDDPEFVLTLLTSPRQTCTIILDGGSTPPDTEAVTLDISNLTLDGLDDDTPHDGQDDDTPHVGHDVKNTPADPNKVVILLPPLKSKAEGIKCSKAKARYGLTPRKPTDDDKASTSSV